jgi:ribulose-5-phosphate 4-epimerase/fuculose-1-phosphate aldolase
MSDLQIRQNLAAAYQILAYYNLDDLTYTHLSARSESKKSFFIYPFGLLFSEVTASSLLEVDFDGNVICGEEYQYNKTGFVIHGSIYKEKPKLNAIFHLHTIPGVAVSAMEEGLLFVSQFALHFYQNIAYHNYDSLALEANKHGNDLCADLADNMAMFLQNHGTITCGETIHEAMFYTIYLEKACKTQCALINAKKLVIPSSETCMQAKKDMRNFENDLGKRDWLAMLRILEKNNSNYQD